MSKPASESLPQLVAAFLFAYWHTRRMPLRDVDSRRRKAVWCRDHCGTFAARWFAVAAAAWLLQLSPLGLLLSPGGVPLLGLVMPLAFMLGVFHLAWQIIAQQRAGLPPIDPPVEVKPARQPPRRERSRPDKPSDRR